MEKILQGIIQSEEEALGLENEAKQQASVIITEAEKKAAEILEKSVQEGETLSGSYFKKPERGNQRKNLQAHSNPITRTIRINPKSGCKSR